jgi:hypothetical protein
MPCLSRGKRWSNVIPTEVVEALPASRSQYVLAVLPPGTVKTGRSGCRWHGMRRVHFRGHTNMSLP